MKFRELNREDSKKIFDEFVLANGIPNDYFKLDSDYQKIRDDILSFVPAPFTKNYDFDLKFALKLHEYFSKKNFEDFNEAVASNYGFWRFICLKVVPDIILNRHGLIDSYFYEKNVRIYIPTLWWFIEMSFQGSYEKTYECLKDFSTDFILQFVERPGRGGMYLDVTRLIFKYLSILPQKIINEKKGDQTLIRRILIQHTAMNNNYDLIIDGNVDLYVRNLFKTCGVEVKDYE